MDLPSLSRLRAFRGKPIGIALAWDLKDLVPVAQSERKVVAEDCDSSPARVVDKTFFAVIADLVGAASELVGERGIIAWQVRRTVRGGATSESDSTACTPLRFPGQSYEPETGLHYNYFRYYDPKTGRYVTPDPLGLAPAANPSTYVGNPHSSIDPLGLSPCPSHLLRGTTRGFEGSPGVQRYGITPTPSDPGVATVFATHAERFGDAVVEFIHVPRKIGNGDIDPLLEYDVPKLSPEQIAHFVEEAHRRAG